MNLQPVIWSEGMLLSPQHFQQQEQFLRQHSAALLAMSCAHHHGFYDIAIDTQLLRQGKFALRSARGIMPDVTPFDMPAEQNVPAPVDISADQRGHTVYLALPLKCFSGDVAEKDALNARYHATNIDRADENCAEHTVQSIEVGNPNFRFVVASKPPGDCTCLAIAVIQDVTATGEILLDDCHIPSILSCHASSALLRLMTELLAQLHKHIATHTGYLSERPHETTTHQWLLLSQINRHALVLAHFVAQPFVHPYQFFLFLLQLYADCVTGNTQHSRAQVPVYQHGNLRHTFEPLLLTVKILLERSDIHTAHHVVFQPCGQGLLAASLAAIALGDGYRAVLAIKSNLAMEHAHHKLATTMKVAPTERIRQLVNLQLPGAKLLAMTTPPCEVRFEPDHCYFEIDRNTAIWNDLKTTSSIALHLPAGMGDIDAALWLVPI